MPFNRRKFRALVHYICYKAQNPAVLGATKLNKVLWFSDAAAFALWGESITGETYIKQQFGPVPRRILPTLRELQGSDDLVIRESAFGGVTKRDFIALTKPTLEGTLCAEEVGLIDEVFQVVCLENTARSISELTHNRIWAMAAIGEEIPLFTTLVAQVGEITENDIAWAKKEAAAA